MRGLHNNDWDSFDELHITVEHLEVIQQLLRSRSHGKARAAVILLDHVADVLMYRVCSDDFESQTMMELVMPPSVTATKRDEILFRFEKKVSYLSQTKKVILTADATVLLIGHRVRNLAYHRDYHNPNAISAVGRILYKTVCGMLPILSERGSYTFSNPSDQEWTNRYGITANYGNYQEVLKKVSGALANGIKLDLPNTIRILRADLAARFKSVSWSLTHWFSFRRDKDLDAMLKHYQFQDLYRTKIEEFRQPLKEARYLVHELHKGVPPDEWQQLPVPPEKRYEIRRAMIVAERQFKTLRRRTFRDFRQTATARSLRVLERKIKRLGTTPSLSRLLLNYDLLDRELAAVQLYVSKAEADAEFASDRARGK
jgi:hypothetical protein